MEEADCGSSQSGWYRGSIKRVVPDRYYICPGFLLCRLCQARLRKELSLLQGYSIFLPSYTIGHHIYSEVSRITSQSGTQTVIIGGHKALAAAYGQLSEALAGSPISVLDTLYYGGECTFENVEKLAEQKAVQEADMIFAVGGGKATDTCKALGEQIGKPVYAFPTIASNCAGCTAVAIMYHEDGSFFRPNFLTKPPVHTFIDLDIIAKAPARYLWAGMGDTYAKYFEAEMSSRGEDLSHYVGLGVTISQMCLKPILAHGVQALKDNKAGIASKDLEEVVLAVIVTTALTSILVTKDRIIDYNTGLAHAINYGLTSFPEVEKNHLHGEIVSFGVLILLLVDKNYEMFEKMYTFSRQTGLPVRMEDLGLHQSDQPQVIAKALAMKDIDHNPYKITAEMMQEAFEELKKRVNAEGEQQ